MDNKAIRQKIRFSRKNMPVAVQQKFSSQIVKNIIKSTLFKKCQNFALFLPNDNEPDLSALIAYAWAMGKNCYLPVLGRKFESRLNFQLYLPDSPMIYNCYGIPEPEDKHETRLAKSWRLDLILMPLVAFDANGNRIGMGGGYYDKTFQYRRYRTVWQKPPLMGVAYAEQQVSEIKAEKWDIPLDYVVTNKEIRSFRK
ncbi:MAG: 5-formyltetrahydrofolate cyclo-ligase [Thiohalomonadales bacterium]